MKYHCFTINGLFRELNFNDLLYVVGENKIIFVYHIVLEFTFFC